MTLRVSQLDGKATLTLPHGTSDRAAEDFLSDNAVWLVRARSRLPEIVAVGAGVLLPVEGRMMSVQIGTGKTAKIESDQIIAPVKNTGAAVKVALRFAANVRFDEHVAACANAIGRNVNQLTMRDPRSRWGSCSTSGSLMFSWRLIMAPPNVLDYVAAHEVAHLQEMNHSCAFWAVVAELFPDYKAARQWLRKNGNQLHRYRFD
ncbi:MAG: M48 family metallopeptidase [Boseongicola sp.]